MAPSRHLCQAICFCVVLQIVSSKLSYHTAGDILHWYSRATFHHASKVMFEDIKFHKTSLPVATLTDFTKPGNDTRPVAVLVFAEHAREPITSEVAIWLSKVLVQDVDVMLGWPELSRVMGELHVRPESIKQTLQQWSEEVLSKLVLKILPVVNMDGRLLLEQGDLCRRKSASGVDLNRNYPFAWRNTSSSSETYGGPRPLSEPQSKHMTELCTRWKPKAFVNVHSGEWAVYTPWDSRTSLGAGLPGDMAALIKQMGDLCGCIAGPAGAVSGYLAFGTSMDYMYSQLHVPYPITIEVYGGGREGKLQQGEHNADLSSFKVTPIKRTLRGARGLLQTPSDREEVAVPYNNSKVQPYSGCFTMYNPLLASDYREVIARWVVIMLTMLRDIGAS